MNKCSTLLLTLTIAMPLVAQQTKQPAPAPQQTAAPTSLPPPGKDDTVVEEIVARVNNSIVTREDLRRSRDQMMQEVRQQSQGGDVNGSITEREKNLLRDLIDQNLLVQKGTDLGLSVDTELVKRLDDLRKDMKAESIDDLEKIAQQQGVSFEDFKQNMKNNLMTQKVISSEVGGHIQFTREEIQKFYDDHKKEFDLPERIRLAEILIPAAPPSQAKDDKGNPLPPMDPTPEQVAAAKAKADEAMAKLKAGVKWQDVAKQYSSGPTAQEGGDLGFFKRG